MRSLLNPGRRKQTMARTCKIILGLSGGGVCVGCVEIGMDGAYRGQWWMEELHAGLLGAHGNITVHKHAYMAPPFVHKRVSK